jgi:DNA-binding CsgD family transcriptional regulator
VYRFSAGRGKLRAIANLRAHGGSMRPLDENELKALRLFANGRTADEMAIALDMSKSAAQYYLRVAARKLGARNRVHAVAIAVELGLVKPSDRG